MTLKNNLSFEALIQMYEDQYEHRYDEYQLDELRDGYDNGLDISIYANPSFDRVQMRQIRIGLENGVDVYQYAFVHIDWQRMAEIRLQLEYQRNASY